MCTASLYAKSGGTALPMVVLTTPSLPSNLNESGKLCNLIASLIVKALVAIGCTLLHPDIIPKVV